MVTVIFPTSSRISGSSKLFNTSSSESILPYLMVTADVNWALAWAPTGVLGSGLDRRNTKDEVRISRLRTISGVRFSLSLRSKTASNVA